ncbi:MAG: hypothetical protein ACLVK4_14210 [Alistipes shahii]|uniref:hypothetical protein n=1 Tax=Alistipes shahii TaxID=328814 RepID=UPI00399C937E
MPDTLCKQFVVATGKVEPRTTRVLIKPPDLGHHLQRPQKEGAGQSVSKGE